MFPPLLLRTVAPLFSLLLAVATPLSTLAGPDSRQLPLPLREIANRGLRDDATVPAGSGWLNHGPESDLSSLPSGPLTASQVPFVIADPAANDHRTVLVLGRTDQPIFPKSATLNLPKPAEGAIAPRWKNLYLLHAGAWIPSGAHPVGHIIVRYADHSVKRHAIANGRDLDDWRNPALLENAAVGWTGTTPSGPAVLYVSGFALDPRKTPVSVSFESTGSATWMIVAATLSADDLPFLPARQPLVIAAGQDWAPYAHSVEVAAGGVFDFSARLEAPAGKYGALRTTPAGHFEFARRPGERVRFWGPNLTFTANYLSRDEADRLAERFARSGYNTVRFHHYDESLVRPAGSSWELDPGKLDQLDYLFAAMKKRGLYINIDLFSIRAFTDEELRSFGFPAGSDRGAYRDHFKGLVPISEAAFASWSRFARALLTHRNPHTGLTWAEDPALIGICPVNEDQLFNRISHPAVLAVYQQAFVDSGAGPAEDAGKRSSPLWNRFIYETQIRSNARIFAFLRSLGVQALLTGSNSETTQGLAFVREQYDYVDNHAYWDHPRFPVQAWRPPFAFHQESATRSEAAVPRKLMPTRIFGLPFTATEYNFCRPNRYRAEGAVLMPAYAGLQDWDALYNFQYAMSRESALAGGVDNYFALANDPIGLVADRVGALLFLRGDIAPGRRAIAYAVPPEEAYRDIWLRFPERFSTLGLVARIGSLTGRPAEVFTKADSEWDVAAVVTANPTKAAMPRTYPLDDALPGALQRDGIIPTNTISPDHRRFTSDTAQIELRSDAGTVKVVAPRCELFVLPCGQTLEGDRAQVRNIGPADAVVSVVSLDGQPVATSRRLLITHLTDVLPTGARFAHQDRKLLESWGQAPHLVQRGEVALALRLPPGEWQAWAVDATGARVRRTPFVANGEVFTLTLSTITPEGTQLAYELAR